MNVKDHSGFYHAGAKALRILAAGCGEARIARIFEDQAERFLLMAEVCARSSAATPPAPAGLVAAKRPNYSLRGVPQTRHTGRPTAAADLPPARASRQC